MKATTFFKRPPPGKAWVDEWVIPPPAPKPLQEHLKGQHDQKTHGAGGAGLSLEGISPAMQERARAQLEKLGKNIPGGLDKVEFTAMAGAAPNIVFNEDGSYTEEDTGHVERGMNARYIRGQDRIELNSDIFVEEKYGIDDLKRSQKAEGHSVKTRLKGVEYVVTHELGHHLDDRLTEMGGDKGDWWQGGQKTTPYGALDYSGAGRMGAWMQKNFSTDHVSDYGASDASEGFAEAFVAHQSGGKAYAGNSQVAAVDRALAALQYGIESGDNIDREQFWRIMDGN